MSGSLPLDTTARGPLTGRLLLVRALVVLTLLLGTSYVVWRWGWSVPWEVWWIAVPLVVAETYSLVDAWLFGVTAWRLKQRGDAPPAPAGVSVDVLITTYNEDVELVMTTALAAQRIRYPHRTYVLDDGNRPEMRSAAEAAGVGYITRSEDWVGKQRHAKAGNLNNALFATDGELMLVLDADQVPAPEILDRTIGWFDDPRVALVQTPQYFTNVTDADPFGVQAPLFYGPIQQGKDGWNAAFFCGSNAVLRREALMQIGVVGYVRQLDRAVRDALRTADRVLARAVREARRDPGAATTLRALTSVRDAAARARRRLDAGEPAGEVTYDFQRAVDAAARDVVADDVAALEADLRAIAEMGVGAGRHRGGGPGIAIDEEIGEAVVDEAALERLAAREWSPLGALESVRAVVRAVDVDRADEAQPVMPMATISVTEDMATAMRLHALGWRSVYHHEVLAHGLAPEDLGTMLTQRLRWAQGTLQVMLRENPLVQRGLSLGQKLMYSATMWTYLSGFFALVYIAAPVLYLCVGVQPVEAYSVEFFARLLPFLVVNQLLFAVVGRGIRTWRGQQYSLALFPLWITACATAVGNVFFGRGLGFAVTPKNRQAVDRPRWDLVRWQLVAVGLLVVSVVVGVTRWALGAAPALGTWVNVAWVVYDLFLLSVLFRAATFRPADDPDTATTEGASR
ncbi:glycosyltransferase family 2 protein [Aquipuribacter nitratireducens]|uniref:Glycosyltransferase family 2 protein n=1 Tax=Aquipuribacter nitratireducens TaxID=650104 RepID=A0ABW0GNQ5_9MICO